MNNSNGGVNLSRMAEQKALTDRRKKMAALRRDRDKLFRRLIQLSREIDTIQGSKAA